VKRKVLIATGGLVAALLLATLAYTQLRERRFTRVLLTPDNMSLAPGGTQQFQVYGLLSGGDTIAVRARYRATGGVITAGGLYTAGPEPGSYQVTAIPQDDDYEVFDFDRDDLEDGDDGEDDIELAATAMVTVTGAGAPEQAPSPVRGFSY
jgi:hypothetical protein